MNKETANCTKCGNVNEVKISAGINKPLNKGKKYFTCMGCTTFQWVNGNTPTQQTTTPPAPIQRTVTEEKVDWSAKDRQSMAQTAMQSASEIVAAMISAGMARNYDASETPDSDVKQQVKNMANEFYKELLKMKQLKEDYP